METVTELSWISRDLTALSPREQSALIAERDILFELLERTRVEFRQNYAAYLNLEVNKSRAQYRKQVMADPLLLRAALAQETPQAVAYTGDDEQSRRRCHLATCATLHNAAIAALQSCQRMALIIYRAYAGAGRLDLICATNPKPLRGRQTIDAGQVLARINRKLDHASFRLILEVAEQLRRVSGSGPAHPIRPEHRFEGIQLAIERLLADLARRE